MRISQVCWVLPPSQAGPPTMVSPYAMHGGFAAAPPQVAVCGDWDPDPALDWEKNLTMFNEGSYVFFIAELPMFSLVLSASHES